MPHLPRHGWLLALLLALLPAFASVPLAPTAQSPTNPSAPIDLRVMTFNIWLGGVQVDFAQVVQTVRTADADVVGLQESEAHVRPLAEALGWRYVDERLQIISRFPLIDPPGGDGLYTFVEPTPGRVVALANVHLTSDPYGPEAVRDGASPDEVLALERETRLPEIERHLAVLPALVAAGIPVILTGDFNSPSHLDWTEAVVAARGHVRYPLTWPVAAALADAGFRDSFREAHPDPVARPGLTWTPGYPPGTLRPNETLDRIDWILVAGDATTRSSALVGEGDNPDVDIAVDPFPSDHRGVVSTIRVVPAVPPALVAVNARIVTVGDELIVRYHAPGDEGDRIALLPAGGTVPADVLMSLPPQESAVDGSVVFGTDLLTPGAYAAVLIGAGGDELARIPFSVQSADSSPAIFVEQPTFAAGDPIAVRWNHAPGHKFDWVGVYAAGDPDLYNYLAFQYTRAETDGSLTFDESTFGGPLPPGEYEARLFRDDGYVLLASVPFEVVARDSATPESTPTTPVSHRPQPNRH